MRPSGSTTISAFVGFPVVIAVVVVLISVVIVVVGLHSSGRVLWSLSYQQSCLLRALLKTSEEAFRTLPFPWHAHESFEL